MKRIIGYFSPQYYQKYLLSKPHLSVALKNYLSTQLPSKKTHIKDIEFLVLDFETTGLDIVNDKIISLGFTLIKNLNMQAGYSKHFLINPEQFLTEENVKIHQITDDDLSQGISLSEAMDILFVEMRNRVIIVHFDKIEKGFINSACQRLYQICPLPIMMIDTMKIENKKVNASNFSNANSLRLFNLRKKYNLPRYKAHNAMQDAIATAELFLAQVSYKGGVDSIKLKELI